MVGVRRVLGHLALEVLDEQRRPRLVEDGAGHLAVVQQQLGEEELVGQPAHPRSAVAVDLVTAAEIPQRQLEVGLDVGEHGLGSAQHGLGLAQVARDALLLLPAQVLGDRARHHPAGQPAPLVRQLGHPLLGPRDLRRGMSALLVELGLQPVADGLLHLVRHSDRAVVLLDRPLDVLGRQIRQRAGRPALLAPDAEEVEVAAPWRWSDRAGCRSARIGLITTCYDLAQR